MLQKLILANTARLPPDVGSEDFLHQCGLLVSMEEQHQLDLTRYLESRCQVKALENIILKLKRVLEAKIQKERDAIAKANPYRPDSDDDKDDQDQKGPGGAGIKTPSKGGLTMKSQTPASKLQQSCKKKRACLFVGCILHWQWDMNNETGWVACSTGNEPESVIRVWRTLTTTPRGNRADCEREPDREQISTSHNGEDGWD